MRTAMNPELLTESDVAAILQVSLASVRRWRFERHGPKYLKVGASVRYRRTDLTQWLDSRPAGGELTELDRPGAANTGVPA
jgi:predicted DNA-binding transcriptional regulator AlpA